MYLFIDSNMLSRVSEKSTTFAFIMLMANGDELGAYPQVLPRVPLREEGALTIRDQKFDDSDG